MVKYLQNAGIYGVVLTIAFIAAKGGFLFVEDSFDKFHTTEVFKNEMSVLSTMPWNAVSALAASEKFRPQTSYMSLCADRYACTREVVTMPDGRKKVTLEVSWRNSEGIDQTRRFFTFLGRNALKG